MNTTYTQKNDTVQKVANTNAESVKDSSTQNDSLQRKADMANGTAQRAADPRPNNTGLPDNLKTGIESLSGFSMDDVRVHYNSSKPAAVHALAYTQGTDIHVAPGQEHALPHEAWHVAQQMAGRVAPTTNINGMPVNDNAGLEHEADVMGEKALQRINIPGMTEQSKVFNSNVVQCGREDHLLGATGCPVIKILFAGSGYTSWRNENDNGDEAGNVEGHSYRKSEDAYTVSYSFPGPQCCGGARDESPSITQLVQKGMDVVNESLNHFRGAHLLIEGHSRGAVAAGELYNIFVSDSRVMECDVVLLDPVPGPDGRMIGGHGDNNLNQDVNGQNVPSGLSSVSRRVVFYSLGLGVGLKDIYYRILFNPQKITQANVIVLTKTGHSCYLDDARDHYFMIGNCGYTYDQLCCVEPGVYIDNQDPIVSNDMVIHNLREVTDLGVMDQYSNLSEKRRNTIMTACRNIDRSESVI